jgi:hypothetical protein
MNTTYASKINPRFDNAGVQDVSADLSVAKAGLDVLVKQNENELNALRNIAQDQAQIDFNRGAAELVDKYGTDFKGLNDAMMKLENDLYGQIKGTHPEMAENLLRQNDSVRLRAVDAAHRKYISDNDRRIKEGTGMLLDSYRMALPDDYADYLYNQNLPAEQQEKSINERWVNNLQQIDALLNRRDMNGNYIYDKNTRQQKKFLQAYMLDGGKTMVDRYFQNNDEEGLKKYYESQILAPERYRKLSGMDRDTYDKFREYAKKTLEQMGVKTKNMRFKQSISDAISLQREFSEDTLKNLEESGILPEKITKQLRENNVKFSKVDPTKEESPLALFDVLNIVNSFDVSNGENWDEQVNTVETSLDALNKMADYAQENGLSQQNIQRGQEAIVNKEQDAVFGKVYEKFGTIIDNLQRKLNTVRKPKTLAGKARQWFQETTNWDGMPNEEKKKLITLEMILGNATDRLNAAKLNGEPTTPIFNETYAQIARQVYYPDIDWASVDQNPDEPVEINGELVKIIGYTDDGDIKIERK